MSKTSLALFITLFLGLLLIFQWIPVSTEVQVIGSILLILFLGIPHGAIDHVLFLERSKTPPSHFYLVYLGLMAFYLGGWLLLPVWSLLLFLGLSAVHFGQSQFSDLTGVKNVKVLILGFLWGASILSGLVLYNLEGILTLLQTADDLTNLSQLFHPNAFKMIFWLSSVGTIVFVAVLNINQQLETKRALMEIFAFLLIHLCFFALPPLIAFTLYFTTLHSYKVLEEEFTFLKQRRRIANWLGFIRLLLPYSVVSIVGAILLMVGARYIDLGVSDLLLVFMLLSILTLPHSIVMDYFYQKRAQIG